MRRSPPTTYCGLGRGLALPPPPTAQIGKKGVLIYYLYRRLENAAGTFRCGVNLYDTDSRVYSNCV